MAAKLLARHGRKHLEIGARSTAPQQRECKNASHHLGTERPEEFTVHPLVSDNDMQRRERGNWKGVHGGSRLTPQSLLDGGEGP